MLFPQINKFRQLIELSGFWNFRFDFDDEGFAADWCNGFENDRIIAVPASWNDQFVDHRDFLGPAWYQTKFNLPWGWKDQRVILRFDSVNYLADVWVNGKKIGQHEGGHLPFEFDISSIAKSENNQIILRVDGTLARDRVPPENSNKMTADYPPANFDFFPFCGIQRPVIIYSIPKDFIKDITVNTSIEGNDGIVFVKAEIETDRELTVSFSLRGHGKEITSEVDLNKDPAETTMAVSNAAFWGPGAPNLYELTVELSHEEEKFDSYKISIGIRTVEVRDNQLLLNGKPIYLRGFGRHEDFPIIGRGFIPAVIIKDYSLMQWIGANSFRTSHYPYSEQMMDLADRLGFLIINEIPAVGLTFHDDIFERHLELCKQYIQELINRDKNHPSVIIWSLANEPHKHKNAKTFFNQLYNETRKLDSTRPITFVSGPMLISEKSAFTFCDLVCVNRYYAWYYEQGQINKVAKSLSDDLDKLHKKYSKPIIMSEFGAGAIPGWHAQPPEMWSEEYQADFLKEYIRVLNSKSYVIGQHIWCMCDFKTGQSDARVGAMNNKGVFTRDRRPKMAAHVIRELWKDL